jgi:hypothetical protein
MTYAMTLDNSWELMSEEEMYDVNGGIYLGTYTNIFGCIENFAGWLGFSAITFYNLYTAGFTYASIFGLMGFSFAAWKIGMFTGAMAFATIELAGDGSYEMHKSKVLGLTVAMWAAD